MTTPTLPFVKARELVNTVHASLIRRGGYAPEWMVENWVAQAKAEGRFNLSIGQAGYRVDPDEMAAALEAEIKAIERGETVRTCTNCGCSIIPNWYDDTHAPLTNALCGPCNAVAWQSYVAAFRPAPSARSETWGT